VKNLFWGLALLLLAGPALAQWELDNARSSIDFISVKNAAIAESHHFSSLVGYIGSDGNASVTINLDSVETLIPIRNERMRAMLFDTSNYPTASVTTAVEPAILAAVAKGGTVSTEVPFKLSLHGMETSLTAPVVVIGEADTLRVVSTRPILIGADDYNLGAGVEALREVAGLANISTAVPVTIDLLFTRAK
jgi:polyisoprenoid-binding protein YceI